MFKAVIWITLDLYKYIDVNKFCYFIALHFAVFEMVYAKSFCNRVIRKSL